MNVLFSRFILDYDRYTKSTYLQILKGRPFFENFDYDVKFNLPRNERKRERGGGEANFFYPHILLMTILINNNYKLSVIKSLLL